MPEIIEVKSAALNALLTEVDQGLLKIPRFQREVVWDLSDSVKLLDSIYRGFPIGSLVIWETWEKLAEVRSIGNLILPEPSDRHIPSYVLDGQQRLTSIYACAREALVVNRKRKRPVRYVAWFDLDAKVFTTTKPEHGVTLSQLIAPNYDQYRDPLQHDHKQVFSEARAILIERYKFPCIVVRERDLEDACTIFERINNSGKKLTVFDLLVAKAYPLNFDLREKWKQLEKSLKAFAGLNPILPMQALSLLHVQLEPERTTTSTEPKFGCHKRHLLSLKPETIVDSWNDLSECFQLAVDFLASRIGVPTARLVPYEAPIALLTLFFLLNRKYGPTETQAQYLSVYFWRSCVGARYAGSPESSMEEDAQSIRAIHSCKFTEWSFGKRASSDEILAARYDRRDALVLTILASLASRRPLSFKAATPIPVANEFSKFNATELHHVFPRGWLKRTNNPSWLEKEHSLANICLSPSREQRHEIGAKPPGDYLAIFEAHNPRMSECLDTHLMGGG